MSRELKYTFIPIENCNLCNAQSNDFKILGKRLNQSQGKKPQKKVGITTSIQKCKNCGLIFSNPLPIPNSIEDHYGVDPKDYWKEEYFKINPNYFTTEIKHLQELLPFLKGQKALDIGAGIGKAMIAMDNAGYDVYGFEPSSFFHQAAIEKMNIESQKLKLSSIEEAAYSNETFDFITFGAVLEHLYDPSESIKKALSWLKPGGIIHIEVPSSDWLIHKIINWSYHIRGLDYVANLSPMHTPFHLYEFSLASFKKHAKANDYVIAAHNYFVCQTYMPKTLDLLLKPLMKWTNTGMQLSIWLRKNS